MNCKALATRTLSIVIPTHNRSAALMECLQHLEIQTFPDFDVIVADDGSTDDTAEQMEAYRHRSPLSLRYFRQPNAGPARARNRAIGMVESSLCLMLGDDIFASSTLVERHVELHRKKPDLRVASLGLTRWSTSGQKVTPLMRWLDEGNVQFAYPRLLAGEPPDWRHFYTSNLAVKTELLQRFAFNEQFPYAAMEDAELAYRITKCFGLEIHFVPEAQAGHLHPTTFRQACARMVRAGYSAGLFYDLWPEQRPPKTRGRREAIQEAIARKPRLLQLLAMTVSPVANGFFPKTFIPCILFSYFELGLRQQLAGEKRLQPAVC
jgi:glycosyltransferase involved in cell wall biosynthesis